MLRSALVRAIDGAINHDKLNLKVAKLRAADT